MSVPPSFFSCLSRLHIGWWFHSSGFATTCALNAFGGVLAVVLYMSYKRDNARRVALHGCPDPDAPVDTSELADKVSLSVVM